GVLLVVVALLDVSVVEVDACVFGVVETPLDDGGHGVAAPVDIAPPETEVDTPGQPPLTPVPVVKPLASPLLKPLVNPLDTTEDVSSSHGMSAVVLAKPLLVRPLVSPLNSPPERIEDVSSSHGVSTVPPSNVVLVPVESQPLPVSSSVRQASEDGREIPAQTTARASWTVNRASILVLGWEGRVHSWLWIAGGKLQSGSFGSRSSKFLPLTDDRPRALDVKAASSISFTKRATRTCKERLGLL
ncbi:hypothetical protein PF008_g32023, partial [Phytophthora fragariae]